ncbi:MAG TPA: DUF1580 domain-containing protein [Gemmataceae bacterium]|nr:DUF1580 domain-containing protein [Gemmataceae bacterium]
MTATANISDRISRLTEEGLIGMVEAAASMGTFRGGRPCHPSTIARWSTKGIRLANGEILKLEVLRCGNSFRTSKAALRRFVEAQQDTSAIDPPRTPTERRRANDRAAAELAEMGVK